MGLTAMPPTASNNLVSVARLTQALTDVYGRLVDIRGSILDLQSDITAIESRLTNLENNQEAE